MKKSNIFTSLLLAPVWVLLLMSLGCKHAGHGGAFTPQVVHILNCTATPKTIDVHEDDTIQWIVDPPDAKVYTIKFGGRKPVPSHSFPSTSPPQPVKADLLCTVLPGSKCYYDYTMTPITNPPSSACNDPGVHVTPN